MCKLNNDQLINFYLDEQLVFDTGIWLEFGKVYELICYSKGIRVSRPLFFFNRRNMIKFCMWLGCETLREYSNDYKR